MAEKKSFLLRMDDRTLTLLKRWADDEMRSLNGHIEYLLRRNLREAGRLKETEAAPSSDFDREPDTTE